MLLLPTLPLNTMPLFVKTDDSDYVCYTWFERDRQNIRLETPKGRVVFDFWDDDLIQAIEGGFLTTPKLPRPNDNDWQPHAVAYAKKLNLI